MIRRRQLLALAALSSSCLWGAASCSSDSPAGSTPGAAGASASAGATSNTAGTSGSLAGSSNAGASAAGASAAGASGAGTAGASNSAGASGAAAAGSGGTGGSTAGASGTGTVGLGGGTHTAPTCVKNTPSPNAGRASECDYLLQSLDFEDTLGYTTTAASVKTTAFGSAFGLSAINSCSPYCYSKNLTVGIDIVGGSQAQTQGEIILEFPATGAALPITVADMNRNSLAWITFDGAAAPPFEIDTQLIIETATGVVAAKELKTFFKPGGKLNPFGPFSVTNDYSYGNGSEFKYFNVVGANGFPDAPTNVTGMGFRIVAKATAGQEWHGVAYIDHLQIRAGAPNNPTDKGAYPFGLN